MKLRFGTGLKTQIVAFTVTDNLLNYGTHLIHLNRIDDEVLPRIMIGIGSLVKTLSRLFNSIIKDVRKTQ